MQIRFEITFAHSHSHTLHWVNTDPARCRGEAVGILNLFFADQQKHRFEKNLFYYTCRDNVFNAQSRNRDDEAIGGDITLRSVDCFFIPGTNESRVVSSRVNSGVARVFSD